MRPSIVQIRAVGPGLPPQGATLGTGFLVGPDLHVVTAKHVTDAIDAAAGQKLHVAFAGPDIDTPQLKMRANFTGTEGQVVGTEPNQDLALLQVPGAGNLAFGVQVDGKKIETRPAAARLHSARLREGVPLALSGYPLSEPSLITTAGVLASTFSPTDATGPAEERYLGDFTANPGNSGGPVYLVQNAGVVGVCVAGKLAPIVGGVGAHAAGLTVIVPLAEVVKLLDRHGVDAFASPGPQNPVPAKRPTNKKRKR